MLRYSYGKRFGSKTAWANRKEGDKVGVGPSFLLAEAVFEPNLLPYEYLNILNPSHPLYLSAYEDGTECSETSAYKIQTPGNYSEESIQVP